MAVRVSACHIPRIFMLVPPSNTVVQREPSTDRQTDTDTDTDTGTDTQKHTDIQTRKHTQTHKHTHTHTHTHTHAHTRTHTHTHTHTHARTHTHTRTHTSVAASRVSTACTCIPLCSTCTTACADESTVGGRCSTAATAATAWTPPPAAAQVSHISKLDISLDISTSLLDMLLLASATGALTVCVAFSALGSGLVRAV